MANLDTKSALDSIFTLDDPKMVTSERKNGYFRHKNHNFGSKFVTFISKIEIFDQKWYISVSM